MRCAWRKAAGPLPTMPSRPPAVQARTTRKASSNTSGDRSTLSRQRSMPQLAQQERQQERQPSARPQVERQKSGAAPPPPSQQQQSAPQPPKQQADKVQSPRAAAASPPQPEAKRSAGSAGAPAAPPAAASPGVAAQGAGSAGAPAAAAAAVAGGDGPGSSSPKKRPHRWLEWPAKGCGQFATCISERALKNSMTLPGGCRVAVGAAAQARCGAGGALGPRGVRAWRQADSWARSCCMLAVAAHACLLPTGSLNSPPPWPQPG